MPRKPDRERVAMRHPSGRFTVSVSPARAITLAERGYTSAGAGTTAEGAPVVGLDRKVLSERARALGVPIKGTNEALVAAIQEAEAAAAGDD